MVKEHGYGTWLRGMVKEHGYGTWLRSMRRSIDIFIKDFDTSTNLWIVSK
jgi:hypothetical protein